MPTNNKIFYNPHYPTLYFNVINLNLQLIVKSKRKTKLCDFKKYLLI